MSSLGSIRTVLRASTTGATGRLAARHHNHHHHLPAAVTVSGPLRGYHASPARRLPYKDDQDRESLKPKSAEGTVSGTDAGAAASDAAFDPSKTKPEESKEAAGQEQKAAGGGSGGGNPLEVSGANQGRSKPLGEEGGGEMKDTASNEKTRASYGGSPEKKGKPPAA